MALISFKPRSEASIADLLFKEMRELKRVSVTRFNIATFSQYGDTCNKYDHEADKYNRRIVFGDFSNPKTPKPLFKLDYRDFSDELKANLAERILCGKTSIHRVVESAVKRLIRARHPDDYLEHIKDRRINWRFV